MKVVYIASPYTIGDKLDNVLRQIVIAEQLAELGFLPRWPLASHFWHCVYPHAWEFWMQLDDEEVVRCDAVLRLSGESKGADREVIIAKENNIPVFYNLNDLIMWSKQ